MLEILLYRVLSLRSVVYLEYGMDFNLQSAQMFTILLLEIYSNVHAVCSEYKARKYIPTRDCDLFV